MSKWVAGCLLGVSLFTFLAVGCGVVSGTGGNGKHTGKITVRHCRGGIVEFIRPNNEIFEMQFDPDYLGPQLRDGDVLSDLVYQDTSKHGVYFIKATLETVVQTPDTMFQNVSSTYTNCGGGATMCIYSQNVPMYRWKDGGYRDKPEKK